MLYILGIITGLLFIIMCFSNGLKEGSKPGRAGLLGVSDNSANNKKRDLSEEDVNLIAKILSIGLVDADPNYLSHLKAYRDLRGGAT